MQYLRYMSLLVQLGYRATWRAIGKWLKVPSPQPWTFEIRKWSKRHPYPALGIVLLSVDLFVVGQMLLVINFGWWALPFVLWADFMAFVAGHLFWDTRGRYIPK